MQELGQSKALADSRILPVIKSEENFARQSGSLLADETQHKRPDLTYEVDSRQ